MAAQAQQVHTVDGQSITVYLHEPAQTARGGVVIAPAMAVPQRYYADFADYLAGQGYRVWTFDYRGMGESGSEDVRSCTADLSDWVDKDYEAVMQTALAALDGLPLYVVGHSLGGQTAPLLASAPRIAGLVNVGVGSGAPRHNQRPVRLRSPLLWYLLIPVLCPLFGYFPGASIGLIGDVPRRAMEQWRSWCLTPDYILSGEPRARDAYAKARYPVLSLIFSDDELLLESGCRMMHDAYTGTEVDYQVLTPEEFALSRIGHFGFFRSEHESSLWPLVGAWLRRQENIAA